MSPTSRPVAVLALTLATAGSLTACGPEAGDGAERGWSLQVETRTWNGFDPDHEPETGRATIPAVVGEQGTAEPVGAMTIEVVSVDDDGVEIRTAEPMAPRGESGGLDLNDTEDTFEVALDAPVGFATPTTDGGVTYEVRLVEGAGG